MPKVTNKQIADVFRAARPRIASGMNNFICYAILDTNNDMTLSYKARDIIQGRIQAGIREVNRHEDWRTTLDSYLHYAHGISFSQMTGDEGIDKMRNTRLVWLDSLIKEFDRPGYYRE